MLKLRRNCGLNTFPTLLLGRREGSGASVTSSLAGFAQNC